MTYEDLITQFMYTSFPKMNVSSEVQFEAISAELFGTKQRRYGPMPSPEVQAAIRGVLRSSDRLNVLVPWGSSKQDATPLDILEFFAVRQLLCLRDGMRRHGKEVEFHVRIEDLTDRVLFGVTRAAAIDEYAAKFERLLKFMLGDSVVPIRESMLTNWSSFSLEVENLAPLFYNYLQGRATGTDLQNAGWKGDIPEEQRQYYYTAYQVFYPGQDHKWILARYFAATLARVRLSATAMPSGPVVGLSFNRPVPGTPVNKNRLYYRTLPERHTSMHRAPWMSTGYFRIGEDNACVPKFRDYNEPLELTTHHVDVGGVHVLAPYSLKE